MTKITETKRCWLNKAALILTLCDPLIALSGNTAVAAESLRFGAFAYIGEEQTRKQYQPIADYLNARLAPDRVILEVLPQEEIDRRIDEKTLDIVTTNPTHFLKARAKRPLTGVIATLVEMEGNQPLYRLGGVIIARSNNPSVREPGDIRGKRIGTPSLTHLGGFRAQAFELFGAGFDVRKEAREIVTLKTHQEVVRAVLDGRVDVGFVRSGILEKMIDDKSLRLEDLRIINQKQHEKFPLISSTPLFPEWPVFALPHVDDHLVRRVAAALYALNTDHPAARAAGIYGYTIPADYLPIEDLTRKLRLPPYDQEVELTWVDLWSRYGLWIIATAGLVLLLAGATIWMLIVMHRRARQEARRLLTLMETWPEPMLILDGHRFMDANEAAARLLGYPDRASLVQRSTEDISPPYQADGEPSAEKSARIISTAANKAHRFEWQLRRTDGAAVWVDISLTPIILDHRPVVLCAWHDITTRKAAEEALLQQSEKLRLTLESTADGLFGSDAEGRFTFVNPAACRMLGYTSEQLLGRDVHATIHYHRTDGTPLLADHCPLLSDLFQGKTVRIEDDVFWRADGQPLPVSVAGQPMFVDGKIVCSVVGFTDIGPRKVAERQLRASESEAKAALRALENQKFALDNHAIVSITDVNGAITYANSKFHEISGYRNEELLGRDHKLLNSGHHPQGFFKAMYQRVCQGQVWHAEICNRAKDGHLFWVDTTIAPLMDENGSPKEYISVSTDMTERKQAEAEVEAATRAKSEFLANMSHEIRTPLNAVIGLARIGQRENEGNKAGTICHQILTAGTHLLGIVNDILDFSKIEAGKLNVETHPFSLSEVTAESIAMIRDGATDKGLSLHHSVPEFPAFVAGDALRLRQILANLLSNALKFTSHGGIDLKVSHDGLTALFQVRDSGLGMTPDQLSRLFQAFEQADGSTTRKYGGTGLGLSISRRLARLMGGDIVVESHPGIGSTFTLRLPLPPSKSAETGTQRHAPGKNQRLTGISVLAAEDVELNRLVLADILEQAGASVTFAENGRIALEKLATQGIDAFDVVLMDIQMPEMDGMEATRRIKKMAPDLPVIGLTAHALAEERDNCRAAGMVEHVAKPIEPAVLLAAIRSHVDRTPHADDTANADRTLPQPSSAGKVIDWDALNERLEHRPEFINKMLTTALKSNSDTPAKLRLAASDRDLKTLAFMGHSLKGVAGFLCAHALTELSRELEHCARTNTADISALAEKVAAELDSVLNQLRTRVVSGEVA